MKERLGIRQAVSLGAMALSTALVLTGCGASQSTESSPQVEGQSVLDILTSADPSSNWRIDSFGGGSAVQVILGDPDCAVWLFSSSSEAASARSIDLASTPTFSNVGVGGYYAVIAGSSPMSSCVSGAMNALGVGSNNSNEGGYVPAPRPQPTFDSTPGPTIKALPYWESTENNIVNCIKRVQGACDAVKYQIRTESSFGLRPTKLLQKLVDAGICVWGSDDKQYFDESSAFCRVPENQDGFGGRIEILTGDLLITQRGYEAPGGYAIIGKGWVAFNETGSLTTDSYDAPMRKSIATTLSGHIYRFGN